VQDQFSTYRLTGLAPVESNYHGGAASSLEAGALAVPDGFKGLLHPDNPLFWFGLVLGATFGLVGVSGSARVFKGKASASLGKG
jgi:hypothetical protein